ncbi:MAG TPA: hypothetical protein VFC51_11490 [Chloroflexota bacterium]|nr:hypothetical protein [Chloroflexota bacterium]
MAAQRKGKPAPTLTAHMQVLGADAREIGEVLEIFPDIGDIETFGAIGIPPQQEGHEPERYGYSEAMPGRGADYFTVRQRDGAVLYIPVTAVARVQDGRAILAVDAESIPDLNWQVRPDALAALEHEYPVDEGGEPQVA